MPEETAKSASGSTGPAEEMFLAQHHAPHLPEPFFAGICYRLFSLSLPASHISANVCVMFSSAILTQRNRKEVQSRRPPVHRNMVKCKNANGITGENVFSLISLT